jgi:hypothetical protein
MFWCYGDPPGSQQVYNSFATRTRHVHDSSRERVANESWTRRERVADKIEADLPAAIFYGELVVNES